MKPRRRQSPGRPEQFVIPDNPSSFPKNQAPGSTATIVEQPIALCERRRKVHIRSVNDFFSKWRWALVWITQAIFYGLCWPPWNGRQAELLDIVERKFYIFGLVFFAQDVLCLAILLIVSACALFLFAAVGDRLF